jgi:hypothetical protein
VLFFNKTFNTFKMKNFGKFFVVACGLVLALTATSGSTTAQTTVDEEIDGGGEGCRGRGECGTTPGGVKLNGSWTLGS